MISKLTRQHISNKVFKAYISYIEENYPSIDVDSLIEQAGLPASYVRNEAEWSSVIFDARFTKLLIDATNDPEICYHVGRTAFTPKRLGLGVFYWAKYVMSSSKIYSSIVDVVRLFNRVVRVSIIEQRKGEIRVLLNLDLAELDEEELSALHSNFYNVIQNTRGYFEIIPVVHNKREANVRLKVEKTDTKQRPISYQIEAKYSDRAALAPVFKTALPIIGLVLAIVCYSHFSSLSSLEMGLILAGGFLLSCFYLLISKVLTLRKFARENERTIRRFDEQYKVLQETKENLQRQLIEAQLINDLIAQLVEAKDKQAIWDVACREIVKTLKYDRALIFTPDEQGLQLKCSSHQGLSDEHRSLIENFVLEIDIKSDDPSKLSNVYRFQKEILILNVLSHIKTLEAESQRLLKAFGSRSFIAVPIFSSSRKFGVLCVDYVEQNSRLNNRDLELMKNVAKQIALAAEKEVEKETTINTILESEKMKEEFFANTSHELRTPLHGIIGLAESLRDELQTYENKQVRENVSLIKQSGERLARLVDNILDFSKIKSGHLDLKKEKVSVFTVLSSVIGLLTPLAAKKNIQIKNSIANDSPLVIADSEALSQIFINLIGNAIKFSDTGEVRIESEVRDQRLWFKVIDRGCGIDESNLKRIFESFQQVDGGDTRRHQGSGLGLYITKKLVELQGGEITVDSKLGVGSTFSFSVPASDAIQIVDLPSESKEVESVSLKAEEDFARTAQTMRTSGATKVLVVDDDEINCQVLKNYLASKSYEAIIVNSGKEAVGLIEGGMKPDLVLLDVMMPEMNGYETCEIIRRTLSVNECPVIFLTAKKSEHDIVKGIESGGNDYLIKPFSKGELFARIDRHISVTRTSNAYSRFVPWELLSLLGKRNILELNLGDHAHIKSAVMFGDIRGFTTLSEKIGPSESFNYLADFLQRFCPVFPKHKGFIDKFPGDGFMTLFPDRPEDAVAAAIEIQSQMAKMENQELVIGINFGDVILGTLGDQGHMQGTAIGDPVNVAARLEGLAKIVGSDILVTKNVIEATEFKNISKNDIRSLGYFPLKGKNENIEVFEVFQHLEEKQKQLIAEFKPTFEKIALSTIDQSEDREELGSFADKLLDYLQRNPEDKPASFLFKKLRMRISELGSDSITVEVPSTRTSH